MAHRRPAEHAAATGVEPPPPAGAASAARHWSGAPTTEEEAIAEAVALVKTLRAAQSELATSTAGVQRLQIIATTAWMRALMELMPGAPGVEAAARDLLQGGAVLAKRWWPGQLSILAQACDAATVGAEFGPREAWSWAAIAQQAERYLAGTQRPPQAFEPLEWTDAAELPSAHDQRGADEWVNKAYGAIEQTLRQRLDVSPPAWHERTASMRMDGAAWAALTTAAAQLRYCRGFVVDTRRWAEAMGRLRWLVFHRQHAAKDLQRWLDPDAMPPGGWSTLLGLGVDPGALQSAWVALLSDLQVVRSGGGHLELVAWLRRALAMDGEVLPVTDLARVLSDRADEVFALQDRDLRIDEERLSRRLKKLKRGLAKQAENTGDPQQIAAGMLARAALAAQGRVAAPRSDDNAVPADRRWSRADDDGLEALVAQPREPTVRLAQLLRRQTEGRVALMISDVEDEVCCDTLSELTGMEIDAVALAHEQMDDVCAGLAQGGYDVVIVATSAVGAVAGHRVRRALAGVACVQVRAYRHTVLSSLLGLSRTLGAS